jgi:hypothetical protein
MVCELVLMFVDCICSILETIKGKKMSLVPFSILFPLLKAIVLLNPQVREMDEKKKTELNILASDILFEHSRLGSESGFPTKYFTECVMALIERYPKLHKSGRESLEMFCEDVSDTSNAEGVILILLEGILREDPVLRKTCLHSLGLFEIPKSLSSQFALNVLVARNDGLEGVRTEAETLWNSWDSEYAVTEGCVLELVSLTGIFLEWI